MLRGVIAVATVAADAGIDSAATVETAAMKIVLPNFMTNLPIIACLRNVPAAAPVP